MSLSASPASRANSLSTRNTRASPCSSIKRTVAASRRVFMAFITAPVIGMPKWASNISGMLAANTATVSPLEIPEFESAEASWQTSGIGLFPCIAALSVHHANPVRIDVHGTREKGQRGQSGEICRVLFQILIVYGDAGGHRVYLGNLIFFGRP